MTPPPITSDQPGGTTRPRIRFISTRPAWPLYPGYRLRTANLLRALSESADVDVTFVIPDDESDDVCPPDVVPRSLQIIRVPRLSAPKAILKWMTGSLPMPMTKVDWTAAASQLRPLLVADRCDLVFITPSTAWTTGSRADVPVVIDLDDLDDYKIRHRLSDRRNYPPGVKGSAEKMVDLVDVRRWRKLYEDATVHARCVVVCSETDTDRLGVAHARALPNVYPTPEPHDRDSDEFPTSTPTASNPSALLVGDLTYRPNLEALAFLEQSVLPIVWKSRPDFTVDVVGRNSFGSRRFDDRIRIHGLVDSVTPFLRKSWLVVAPLRSGGGTRIKILEAFAHRIPVVSTTVGAEGIAALSGRHLLLADQPEGFAKAMIELAEHPDLRRELAENAHELFMTRYTFSALCRSMADVLAFALAPQGNPLEGNG